MSELAMFPFDDPNKSFFTIENKIFKGTGQVKASFTMINITDYPYFSDKKSQGWQIFASNMPLNNGIYWTFTIKTGNTLGLRYTQGTEIQASGDFEFYYNICKKPLIISNISKDKYLPVTTKTNEIKFGKIDSIELQEYLQSSEFSYNSIDRELTEDECNSLLTYFYGVANKMYFIKKDSSQNFGLSIAGLIRPLINNNIEYISLKNIEATQVLIILDQGGEQYPTTEYATKQLIIDNNIYYLGEVSFYNETRDQ